MTSSRGVAVTAAALVIAAPGVSAAPERILDVPYLAQHESLCGGAAAAMVLRYWGDEEAHPEEFGGLVEETLGGVRADALTGALAARGYAATAFGAGAAAVADHIGKGRPLIALLDDGEGPGHYVVIVAAADRHVLVHDPATGPFRRLSWSELDAAWAGAGRLAILVVPGDTEAGDDAGDDAGDPGADATARTPPAASEPPGGRTPSAALVDEAIDLGAGGRLEEAEARLDAALAMHPGDARALRELAAIRFRQKRWSAAASLAERAVESDPDDAHAVHLLATSRFLAGDHDGALVAWNTIGAPRVDVVAVPGLDGIDHHVVSDRVGLGRGAVITPARLARARRRLDALPLATKTSLRYRPTSNGTARLQAAVVTRPRWDVGALSLVRTATRAAIEREVSVSVAGAVARGELVTAAWRFDANRPRARLALATPDPHGLPGVLELSASWERNTFDAGGAPGPGLARETRRRGVVELSDWISSSTRFAARVGIERWHTTPRDDAADWAFAGASLEQRLLDDHLAARIAADARAGPGRRGGPATWVIAAAWRSATETRGAMTLHAAGGVAGADPGSPRTLWPRAGTESGGADLRAHPLTAGGVVSGAAFGRTLVHGSIELHLHAIEKGPLRVGVAAFADAAYASRRGTAGPTPATLVDVGAGPRLRLAGRDDHLRIDVAHGVRDGAWAVSAAWERPWPEW